MRRETKKQKITFILGAAGFALLALWMLYGVVDRFLYGDREPESTPAPTASVVTLAPTAKGTTVAGKPTDPATDSFDLSGRTLNSQDTAEIASLQNLQTLSLTRCGITDLGFLATLTHLRTLYLPDNRINDLSALSGLTELKTLYLDNNPLTDLTPLTTLPSLTMLSIKGVAIADYVLADLQASMPDCRIFCDNVVEAARPISLGGTVFTEDVETLDLSWRDVADISKLSYCLQLRELDLTGNPLDALNTLSGLPKLTVLNLSETGIGDAELQFLATLTRLTYLNVSRNPAVTAEGLEALATALPECLIDHDEVYFTVNFGGITCTSDAVELDLTGRALTSIKGMEKFTRLRRLVLYGNGLEDISPLAGCTSLTELDLRYNRVKDLTPLYACRELRWLQLGGNGEINPDEVRRLQEALPECSIETDVDLSMPEPTPAPPEAAPIPIYPDATP